MRISNPVRKMIEEIKMYKKQHPSIQPTCEKTDAPEHPKNTAKTNCTHNTSDCSPRSRMYCAQYIRLRGLR